MEKVLKFCLEVKGILGKLPIEKWSKEPNEEPRKSLDSLFSKFKKEHGYVEDYVENLIPNTDEGSFEKRKMARKVYYQYDKWQEAFDNFADSYKYNLTWKGFSPKNYIEDTETLIKETQKLVNTYDDYRLRKD